MLSRRNIRIKVLQALYMLGRDPEVGTEEALNFYRQALDRSQDLYLFNLLNLIRTAEYAIEDTERKRTKYLPSEEDKKFTAKLYQNSSMQALATEPDLKILFKKKGLDALMQGDNNRKYYKRFAKTKSYKEYVQGKDDVTSDRHILLELYKHLVKEELFEETIDDYFPTWEDDKSLIVGAMKKTIKALPESPELYRTFRPDYEAAVEFGENLLIQSVERDKEFEQIIGPSLDNWEIDRVANIDMILLKMAICEFTSFESIPTKVTLNEYVELSKIYSTDKSKEFINGILDKLLTDLNEQGAIKKSGRGLDE
ncbi:MAG: transcription antitermination factor NusB [Saprospiraceae bacterium]|nr:transcription antitermination factor NusB [Saprospiraceae bacterium]